MSKEQSDVVAEIIKQFLVQTPMAALLLYQLSILYTDWKKDRDRASDERMLMMDRIERLNERLEILVDSILAEKKQ